MPLWTKEMEAGVSDFKGKVSNSQVSKKVNRLLHDHPETMRHRGEPNKQSFAWVLPICYTELICAKVNILSFPTWSSFFYMNSFRQVRGRLNKQTKQSKKLFLCCGALKETIFMPGWQILVRLLLHSYKPKCWPTGQLNQYWYLQDLSKMRGKFKCVCVCVSLPQGTSSLLCFFHFFL